MSTGKLWVGGMNKTAEYAMKDFINNVKGYYTPEGLQELESKLESLIKIGNLSIEDSSPIDKFNKFGRSGKADELDENLRSFYGGLEVMLESLKNGDNKRACAGYELAFNTGAENPNPRKNVKFLCAIIPGCKCTGFSGVVKGEVAKEFIRMNGLGDKYSDAEIIKILNTHMYEPIAKEETKNGHKVYCTVESVFGINLNEKNIDNFYGDRDQLLDNMGKLNSSITTDAQDLEEEMKAVQMEA